MAGLYSASGARKYLNRDERTRVMSVIESLAVDQSLFMLTLAWTGARVLSNGLEKGPRIGAE